MAIAPTQNRHFSRWFSAKHWRDGVQARVHRLKDRVLRNKINATYRATLDQKSVNAAPKRYVLAEGMYDIPNHYFRLKLFLDALSTEQEFSRVAVLRNRSDHAAQSTLEALGFTEFIYLNDNTHTLDDFRPQARAMLDKVKTHADILQLKLPHDLPAFFFYDTVLKATRHAHPDLDNPAWEHYLAEALRNLAIYDDFFANHDVLCTVLSHPFKNEYGVAAWCAVEHNITAYHMVSYFDTMRVWRMNTKRDITQPLEHLEYKEFKSLSDDTQSNIIKAAWAHIEERQAGKTTDINGKNAFRPEQRVADKQQAKAALNIPADATVGVVYSHAWYDFPHTFGMNNFDDFYDWIVSTLKVAAEQTDIVWLFKPHPLEKWYGSYYLSDLASDLPDHIRVLPQETDTVLSTMAADFIVTVHGTVGFEAASQGLPVICADKTHYKDWAFTYEAETREHYFELLRNVTQLKAPDQHQQDLAAVFTYMAFGPHPKGVDLLSLECDSTVLKLYKHIQRQFNSPQAVRETETLAKWITSSAKGYSAFAKTQYHEHQI